MTTFEDVKRTSGMPSPEHQRSGLIVVVCIVLGAIILVLTKLGWTI